MNKNKQNQIHGGGEATIYTNKGFTLVELIVVITILAILSTIGFVSYSGYLAGVRDTNRISQLKAIEDALKIYSRDKYLPTPDDKVDVVSSGATIAYQGDIGANVIDTIGYTSEGKDPKDGTYFSYYLTKNKKYFQLMAHLEEDPNSTALTLPLLNSTNAEINYSKRFPAVEGDKLGILTSTGNTPIHRIESIISSGSLDVVTTTDSYVANISKDSAISGTGSDLNLVYKSLSTVGFIGNSCKEIKNKKPNLLDGVYAISPTGGNIFQVYCDMTTDGGGWTLISKTSGDTNSPLNSLYTSDALNIDHLITNNYEVGHGGKFSDEQIQSIFSGGDGFIKIECNDKEMYGAVINKNTNTIWSRGNSNTLTCNVSWNYSWEKNKTNSHNLIGNIGASNSDCSTFSGFTFPSSPMADSIDAFSNGYRKIGWAFYSSARGCYSGGTDSSNYYSGRYWIK